MRATSAGLRICRLQGIAAALAELSRTHMESDLAAMVLDSLGVTVNELRAAGADAYDLAALTAERGDEPNARQQRRRRSPTVVIGNIP